MSLEEALIIAQRMEEDRVCGPVGLGLRIVYAELKRLEEMNDQLLQNTYGK